MSGEPMDAREIAREIDPVCDCEVAYSGECIRCIDRKMEMEPKIKRALESIFKRTKERASEVARCCAIPEMVNGSNKEQVKQFDEAVKFASKAISSITFEEVSK